MKNTFPPEEVKLNSPQPDPAHMPLILAARTLKQLGIESACIPAMPALGDALGTVLHTLDDRDAEEMLAQQSQVLNAVFNVMTTYGVRRGHPDQEIIHFALRAQKQCRNTLETLRQYRGDQQKKHENEMKETKI